MQWEKAVLHGFSNQLNDELDNGGGLKNHRWLKMELKPTLTG